MGRDLYAGMASAEAFQAICAARPYTPKSMFYSELWLFLLACQQARVTLLIESGTWRGGATRVLAAAFAGRLITIDLAQHVAPFGRVEPMEGDTTTLLPPLLVRHARERIGILLDGPKHEQALALQRMAWQHPAVRVVALHDWTPGHSEHVHSHAARVREVSATFDAGVAPRYRERYPLGPGLGVWMRRPLHLPEMGARVSA